jgi:hypothetical protein
MGTLTSPVESPETHSALASPSAIANHRGGGAKLTVAPPHCISEFPYGPARAAWGDHNAGRGAMQPKAAAKTSNEGEYLDPI